MTARETLITPERTRRALERLALWQKAEGRPGWPDRDASLPCPIHRGEDDNFKLCADGQWFCHSQCGRGGGVLDLIAELEPVTRDDAAAWYLGDEAGQPVARISTHSITKRIPSAAPVPVRARGKRPRDMRPALYAYRLLADLEAGTDNPQVSKKITRQQQAGRSTPSKRPIWQIWIPNRGWQASSKGSELNRQAFGQDDMPERFWYTEALNHHATLEFQPGGDVTVSLAAGDRAPADPRLWIVEGEECATLLAEAGLCAITGPDGASSFKGGMPDTMAAFLARWPAGVVVLPDNDEPGEGYAVAVARAAQAAGVPVWVVRLPGLPAKGDVLDWAWEAGYLPPVGYHAAAQVDAQGKPGRGLLEAEAQGIRRGLLEALADTDEWEDLPEPEDAPEGPDKDWEEFSFGAVQDMPEPDTQSLFTHENGGKPVIPYGLLLLGGPTKMGKTWIGLQLAVSFATGMPAFGRLYPTSSDTDEVLYVNCDGQDLERVLRKRINLIAEGRRVTRGHVVNPSEQQKDNALVARVLRKLEARPSIRFVIVDTLTMAKSGEAGRRGGNLQSLEAGQIRQWQEVTKRGVAVMLVLHTRKGLSIDPVESLAGTNGVTGAADEILVLDRMRGSDTAKLFMTGRTMADRTVMLDRVEGGMWHATEVVKGTGDAGTTEQREKILSLLADLPDDTIRAADLQEELGMTAENARATLRRMERRGQLRKVKQGIYALPPAPKAVGQEDA